jgi:hypothetical protein
MRRLRNTLLGSIAAVLAVASLVWGTGLGAAKSHVRIAPSSDRSVDLAYMRGRTARAVSAAEDTTALAAWSFRDGVPASWQTSQEARATPGPGETEVTTGLTSDVQLRSPLLSLPTGTYRVLLTGRVVAGGLQLGEESADGLACGGGAYFDRSSTSDPARHALPLTFHARSGKPLRIVLLNWAFQEHTSLWHLAGLEIVPVEKRQLSPVVREYRTEESPRLHLDRFAIVNRKLRWSFSRGIGLDWELAPGARATRSPQGLAVRTRRNRYGSELTTAARLQPGRYLLRFDRGIRSGGLMLGALDEARSRWIGQSFYWYGQAGHSGVMGLTFTIGRSMSVQLVLGNWAPRAARSRWIVRAVELDQL